MRRLITLMTSATLFVAALSSGSPESPLSPPVQEEQQHGKFYGAKETVMPDWFKNSFLDLGEDIAESAENNRGIMVFFHQNGCPYCNLFVTKNLEDEEIVSRLKRNIDVIEINMWGDREVISSGGNSYSEKDFARIKKVQFTPTLIFFNRRGKEVLRFNGYIPPEKFKLALDYVIRGMEKTGSFFKFDQERQEDTKTAAVSGFFETDENNLTVGKSPLVVFFARRQCQLCAQVEHAVTSNQDTREIFSKLRRIRLDIDIDADKTITSPQGKKLSAAQWAESLNLNFNPSLVFFGKDGKEVIRIESLLRNFHTQSIADYVVSEAYKTEPEFQRYLSQRAEKIRESGKDVNIWE